MIRTVIIEDEPPAQARLIAALHELEPRIDIVATLPSVAQSLAWFREHPSPDLVFADISLADGLSLEIFETIQPSFPVVFCTAYDEYVLEAFDRNGIAYLLKPYDRKQLGEALHKYRRLETHFRDRLPAGVVASVAQALERPKSRRLFGKVGDRFVAFAVDDLAYIEVYETVTELVHVDGRRANIERSLAELEAELAGSEFFRVSRQVLARANAVAGFRPYFKGRLLVELAPPSRQEVLVSQPNAASFRAWLAGT